MDKTDDVIAGEIEALRRALDDETRRCVELQRKLDRANSEFEEFVSIAAHDLREPLRNIASFSQLLTEANADRLDAESRDFLDRIQNGASRMQLLLSDVVDYCATGTGDRQFSPVDMDAVLRHVLLRAAPQISERRAIITHDPLPAVLGDFDVLAKVLHHLIRNAIAYGDAASPRVHVSSMRVDSDWVLSVHDNGCGIDPIFHSQLFRVFRRLHGNEQSGSGLGLALCKKVVEWHDGRIWVESKPEAGSTFYVALPSAH